MYRPRVLAPSVLYRSRARLLTASSLPGVLLRIHRADPLLSVKGNVSQKAMEVQSGLRSGGGVADGHRRKCGCAAPQVPDTMPQDGRPQLVAHNIRRWHHEDSLFPA